MAAPSTPPLDVSTDAAQAPAGDDELGLDLGGEELPSDDKPFDDTPFDAGVQADEDEDPEKYIQQLAGKLGTTLRKYTEDKGEPDFDLEKFAINSVISATHTAEMDDEDQKDIIKKIKSSGNDEKDVNVDVNVDTGADDGDTDGNNETDGENSDETELDLGLDDDENLDEGDALFASDPKFMRDEGFAPGAEGQMFEVEDLLSDATMFSHDLEITEDHEEGGELKHSMFFNDVYSIYESTSHLLEMDENSIDTLLSDGHGWALDHIATANSQLESVYHFLDGAEAGITEGGESNNYMIFQNLKNLRHSSYEILNMDVYSIDEMLSHHEWMLNLVARANDDVEEVYHFLMGALNAYDGDTESGYEDEYGSVDNAEDEISGLFVGSSINEAEYKGKKVKLGKPMKGDVKKFKVYVKNKKGNVIKVNFGDPNMEIKRDDPERRKSFRARHKCSQAKDRTKPKYWSCKMWGKTPVSKLVAEDKPCWKGYEQVGMKEKDGKQVPNCVPKKKLTNEGENSIFVENIKDMILNKLHETAFESDTKTKEAPATPDTKPDKPSPRKKRIWEVKPAANPPSKM